MTYNSSDIVYKEGVEAIRQNIGMYAGDSSYHGLHHTASEAIDNSVDEAQSGHANKINVTILKDGSCEIEDNGRGIPSDIHPEYKISTLEIVFTKTHASGKFNQKAYQSGAAGLHGIGIKLTNALSEWLEVTVKNKGKIYYQKYLLGKPINPVQIIGDSTSTGTLIKFKPDIKLFKEVKQFDREWFLHRLRDLSYLNPNLVIEFKDLRPPQLEKTFSNKNGLVDYITTVVGESPLLKNPFKISVTEPDGITKEDGSDQDKMILDIVFNYSDSDTDTVLAFTNNVFNKEGGVHAVGFLTALTASFNNLLKKSNDLLSKKEQKELEGKNLRGEDYRQGLSAIISLKLKKPQYSSQIKSKLTNIEVQGAIRTAAGKAINRWIEENPGPAKKILERALLNFRTSLASKKAAETVKKDTKSLFSGDKKLKDCTDDDPTKSELFIVEGDSAGGSAIDGRDPSFQAVIPLGGKILNVWKSTPSKMLAHEEISSLIRALGTGILDEFNSEKCNYNKIIIMCDADVDGLHIRTLLLTFFFQRMRKLIEDGKIYIAQSPLYKVTYLYSKKGCSYCAGKNKNCGICKGKNSYSEYIIYDSDFYSKMEEIALEGASLIKEDGSEFKITKEFLEIVKSENMENIQKYGFTPNDINRQIVQKGDQPLLKFSIKNSTKVKSIPITCLLDLPDAIIQLGQSCTEITRFKGLGEMCGDELAISMDPKTRNLLQIKIEDIVDTNSKFEILMGNSAESRREFILSRRAITNAN